MLNSKAEGKKDFKLVLNVCTQINKVGEEHIQGCGIVLAMEQQQLRGQ